MLVFLGSERRFQRTYASRLFWDMLKADARLAPAHRPAGRAKAHGPCLVLRGRAAVRNLLMVPLKRRPVVLRYERGVHDR
jgi:hypothetical protein